MRRVEVSELRVELAGSGINIVDGVSFGIGAGEVVGLVGESGSGKTTIAGAMLGFARRGARIVGGEVLIDGVDVTKLSSPELARLRGKLVAYIPQDPTAALNPALRIGRQLGETLEVHAAELTAVERREQIRTCLGEVGLPLEDDFLRRYPHQLSGGQQQRVMIACAFLLRPPVIVLDEPTTGLDVTTQHRVLATVRELCAAHGVAALYVTHDLAVIANVGHRVLVAYAGRIVESGECGRVFSAPAHPYTRRLLATIPEIAERRALEAIPGQAAAPGNRPRGCAFAPRCEHAADVCRAAVPPEIEVEPGHLARCVRVLELPAPAPPVAPAERLATDDERILTVEGLDASYGSRQVLYGVSLELRSHECLALVGESGSGKTTIARSIIGLTAGWKGEIRFKGQRLSPNVRERQMVIRRELQYIFQSPYTALNPRRTIGDSIGLPLAHFFGHRGRAAREERARALEKVALPASYADRFPDQLSGGERQRAAIARALACKPEVLICDEVTSALDVSVQAAIVELLAELQREEGLALLFVTHDLALVRTIADRVVVLNGGQVVEAGSSDAILDRPQHAYTRQLLVDTPAVHPEARRGLAEQLPARPPWSAVAQPNAATAAQRGATDGQTLRR